MTKMDIKKIEKYFIFFLYLALFCALVIYSVKYYHNLVENVKNMEFFSLFVIFLIQIIILYLCSIRLYLLLDPLNKIKINVNSLFLIFNASSIFKYVPPKGVNYYMRIKFLDKINNIHGKITSSFGEFVIDLYASEWNADAVEEYDLFRYPIISGSYFSGINQVHPGECMINGRYFDLKECFLTSKYSSVAIECLEGDVEFGLKSREISDVSYSMLFSGGVDSNILRVYSDSQPDYLFTGSFNGAGYDKDVVDNMLGKGLIDRLIKVDVSDEEFISNLKYLVRLRKEPLSVPNEVILTLLYFINSKHKDSKKLSII